MRFDRRISRRSFLAAAGATSVFNLADIYVVASGIFLILFVCTKYRDDDFSFLNIKR